MQTKCSTKWKSGTRMLYHYTVTDLAAKNDLRSPVPVDLRKISVKSNGLREYKRDWKRNSVLTSLGALLRACLGERESYMSIMTCDDVIFRNLLWNKNCRLSKRDVVMDHKQTGIWVIRGYFLGLQRARKSPLCNTLGAYGLWINIVI